MPWVAMVLIGITSNLDNFGAGTAIGLRQGHVTAGPNAVIALITMVATAAAMATGGRVASWLPASTAPLIGGLALCTVGAYAVVVALLRRRRTGGKSDADATRLSARLQHGGPSSRPMATRDAVVLGVSLSLNNIGTGVGGGAARLPLAATTVVTGALSLLAVGLGSRLGRAAGLRVPRFAASIAGGSLLVIVGIALALGW